MCTAMIGRAADSLFHPLFSLYYSYFPHQRKIFSKLYALNHDLAKIEQVAFGSFHSLRKCREDAPLLADRRKIIENIQQSPFNNVSIRTWIERAGQCITEAKRERLYDREKQELVLLEEQLLALRYRSGELDKGYDEAAGVDLADRITPIVQHYLAMPHIFPGRFRKGTDTELPHLTAKEREALVHAATRYPELINTFLTRHDPSKVKYDPWTGNFIKWVLRSGCNVGVFAKAPIERAQLAECHLDKRSGSVDGKKGIHFEEVGNFGTFIKVLCLKIDDKMQPIQGDFKKRAITLRNMVNPNGGGGLTLTIERMYQLFKEKTVTYGPIDYLQGGVRNWNAIKLGSYNEKTKQTDTIKPKLLFDDLIAKVPLVKLTSAEVRERYGLGDGPDSLADGQWGLVLRGSRQKPNHNVLEAHAYAEMVFRQEDKYLVYPIGVQPQELPRSTIGRLSLLTATKVAGVHYPDESFFLRQRQHSQSPGLFFPLSPEETKRLKKTVEEMYQSGKDQNLVFQFGGMNCSYHVQRIFDTTIAKPFYKYLFQMSEKVFSTHNIVFRYTVDSINFKRAFEGLNHEVLSTLLSQMFDHLWEEKKEEELKTAIRLSTELLSKVYKEPLTFDPEHISFDNPKTKEAIKDLAFHTIECIQFYRLDMFESESDQAVLSVLYKILRFLPWRTLKRFVTNVVLLLLGSWRWLVVRKETEPGSGKIRSEIMTFAGQPTVQEGFLKHPAALWQHPKLLAEKRPLINQCIAAIRAQSAARTA